MSTRNQSKQDALQVESEVPGCKPPCEATPADAGPPPFYIVALRTGQHLLKQHPALALTLGYLFLTAVGMVYEFLFLRQFGLQIFDFADASDFLLVAFRQPLLLVFTLLSLLALVQIIRKHAKWMKKSERYRRLSDWFETKRWWWAVERFCYFGIVLGYFVAFCADYASWSAAAIRAGKGRRIEVELVSEANASGKQAAAKYLLLGTTSRYLILFNQTSQQAEVLPVNNLARLKY